MIEENRNGRIQFVGTPEFGEVYEFCGHTFRFEGYEKDGRGAFLKDDTSIRHLPLVKVGDS